MALISLYLEYLSRVTLMKKRNLFLSGCMLFCFPFFVPAQSEMDWVQLFALNKEAAITNNTIARKIEIHEKRVFYIGITRPGISIQNKNSAGVMRQLSERCVVIKLNKDVLTGVADYFESLFPANNLWKLSPALLDEYTLTNNFKEKSYLIKADNLQLIKQKVPYNEFGFIKTRLDKDELHKWLADENIVYIQDAAVMAKEELSVNRFDNSVNKINLTHHTWPLLNGNGTVVSIKENLFDTADIDFKGRILKTLISSPVTSSHASYMATIIGGAGNTHYTGKGAAWGTILSSSDFASLMPDNSLFFQQNNITVQNHSYGTIIENFYGAEAVAYDAQANANPSLLHVFSAGNKGLDAGTQTYAGINGFANTTGNFKMAKNIITVGHVDSFGAVLPPSSRGPAYDGRVKPELVAYAEDGSSGAAAIVSGVSLLLQQAYKEINGVLPASALIKAVLFNTADDVGAKAIDFISGYGSINAYRALKTIKENRIFTGPVTNGNTTNFNVSIPANAVNLKITLCWNDPAATVNSFKALVNDLDLQLTHTVSSTTYKPWVLNSAANVAALNELAVRKRDSLNNAEQITVDAPTAGDYTISVKGFNIPSGTQSFYIAYQWDTLNHFNWNYPSGSDNIFSKQNNLLRWENTYNTTGKLEYSINKGVSWNLMNAAIDLNKNNFYWPAPDTFCTAILRMTIGSDEYVSDTFSISDIIPTGVGFNCPDSAMIYWRKIKGASSYQVYSLGNQYMQPRAITADTIFVIKKNISPALHYTVAPLLSAAKTGVKSYTFNYRTQGVDCYIKNLLADLIDNTGKVQVLMGTLYNVKSICIEKLSAGGYSCIKTFIPDGSLSYIYNDNALKKGGNTYRVKIELSNGQFITSYDVTIYYFDNSEYLLFPNPVKRESGFRILSTTPEPYIYQLFNVTGQLVYQKNMQRFSESVNTASLQKGLYFYLILRDGKKISSGKIVVQ